MTNDRRVVVRPQAEAHTVARYFQHFDRDPGSDDNPFARLARKNEHTWPPANSSLGFPRFAGNSLPPPDAQAEDL
jgi:hypothetical protein